MLRSVINIVNNQPVEVNVLACAACMCAVLLLGQYLLVNNVFFNACFCIALHRSAPKSQLCYDHEGSGLLAGVKFAKVGNP